MSRLTVNRRHSFTGRENLAWFFANKKWIRIGNRIVEAAYAKRPIAVDEAGIRFLILAPKKPNTRAHDRNKIKRWLRAAIAEAPAYATLETDCISRGEQLVILMRVSRPIVDVKWSSILEAVDSIAEALQKREKRV